MATSSRKSTMVELVAELEKLRPLFLKCGDRADEVLEFLIKEAKAGEYHDYKNQKYACGKMAVAGYLDQLTKQMEARNQFEAANGLALLSQQVKQGVYDEEADEEDKEEMRKMLKKNGMGGPGFKEIFGL